LTASMVDKLSLIPPNVWTPAYDAEQSPREGAWVVELTGLVDLSGWPGGSFRSATGEHLACSPSPSNAVGPE